MSMFVVMSLILFLTMQPVDQRQHLSMCFDKIMTDINQSLDSKKQGQVHPESDQIQERIPQQINCDMFHAAATILCQ